MKNMLHFHFSKVLIASMINFIIGSKNLGVMNVIIEELFISFQ